jgi:hypothetical protein
MLRVDQIVAYHTVRGAPVLFVGDLVVSKHGERFYHNGPPVASIRVGIDD